jgi:hypothetical protein
VREESVCNWEGEIVYENDSHTNGAVPVRLSDVSEVQHYNGGSRPQIPSYHILHIQYSRQERHCHFPSLMVCNVLCSTYEKKVYIASRTKKVIAPTIIP